MHSLCLAIFTHRINLINKDQARGILLGLLEQVTDAGSSNSNKHLDELRSRDGKEGHSSLTSNSLS